MVVKGGARGAVRTGDGISPVSATSLWLAARSASKHGAMGARIFDIAIAGGGLSGALIALALRARRPNVSVALIEGGPAIGGHHLWSFFASDIAPASRDLVEPLVAARWDGGYDVAFPEYRRSLPTAYRSVTSDNLARAVADALPADAVMTGTKVTALDGHGVVLDSGERIAARAVIDARGIGPAQLRALKGGWQKFAGQMLELEAPHGLTRPVVMDASVPQHDGYRFVYVLPFAEKSLFVEDTYYADAPALDRDTLAQRIADHAGAQGWRIARISREETGVLPVVTGGDFAALWRGVPRGVALAGVRAGLFQPLTSYSLPDAVRFAHHIAALPHLDGPAIAGASHQYAKAHWQRGRFYRMLAAMLFGAAEPDRRYRVLQRFYRLNEGLIERFYAGGSTTADMARVLAGKPPVPLTKAALVLAGIGAPSSLKVDR
ncbi:lycopene beta-cyclase CrtY [Croceicoccus sp. Ery5]|uniref:lycopene beta-cyclase CrtY n=1 Tax=Croceicoccus sp. Ery5 TaxID=1703340 RepID=UPI001E3AB946|nr:lycopene beta-cyclase CrtY [Croceicoccus sp. Ery5]